MNTVIALVVLTISYCAGQHGSSSQERPIRLEDIERDTLNTAGQQKSQPQLQHLHHSQQQQQYVPQQYVIAPSHQVAQPQPYTQVPPQMAYQQLYYTGLPQTPAHPQQYYLAPQLPYQQVPIMIIGAGSNGGGYVLSAQDALAQLYLQQFALQALRYPGYSPGAAAAAAANNNKPFRPSPANRPGPQAQPLVSYQQQPYNPYNTLYGAQQSAKYSAGVKPTPGPTKDSGFGSQPATQPGPPYSFKNYSN